MLKPLLHLRIHAWTWFYPLWRRPVAWWKRLPIRDRREARTAMVVMLIILAAWAVSRLLGPVG